VTDRVILDSDGGFCNIVGSDDGAVVQPSQNAVEPADTSFGDRVQVGLPGVRHTADGVGGMLGLASNGLDTLDAVRLDEAGRRRTGHRSRSNGR
jgi:hypothetical protein